MSSSNTPTRFVVFIAPTCAGKGFIVKLLHEFLKLMMAMKLLRIGFISFGDIVKGLLETDADFREKYFERMARGDLVDDLKAIDIYQREVDRLMENEPHFIFVDGFGRSKQQIAYMMNNGHLEKGSKVFMIEVSQATCMERFLHRKQSSNKKRVDAEIPTFNKRYELHHHTSPDLRATLKDSDCTLIDINGEGDIMNVVAKEIKGHLMEDLLAAAHEEAIQLHQVRS